MKEELVSIIVPVYNAEKFIEDTIKSVKNQTYSNWELIIINDYSKDNSKKIIEKYLCKNIKLIDLNENVGVSKARNKGIDNAKGQLIAFLDADDLWEKDKLEKQMQVIKDNPNVGLVYTGTKYIDGNGNEYKYTLDVPTTITYKELLKQNIISCSSVLVKKDYVVKYKMQNDNMHEDFAVWLQILREGVEARGINEPLLLYRILKKSKSSNKIKAAKMNYNVYKFLKLNFMQILYYMTIYTYRGLIKYNKIQRG